VTGRRNTPEQIVDKVRERSSSGANAGQRSPHLGDAMRPTPGAEKMSQSR
jgi:hypothetical protein